MIKFPLPQGAEVVEEGVQYSVWAPERTTLDVEIYDARGEAARTVPLMRGEHGYFVGLDPLGRAGDRYKLRPDKQMDFPCPASRFQPEGVHGPSEVIDPRSFTWSDQHWKRPPFRELIIYELHVGTFTPEGTFRAAMSRLPYLVDLGINAIEIMPVADFPGERGWGYDGVSLYAPARCYGKPDDLRAFINAAHEHGIAVILDVVYNHFGPDGNYLTQYSRYYFESVDKTPWGDAVNFGREHSAAVRAFFIENLRYWIEDFHVDGFRLDATHAIMDRSEPHMLVELAETARSYGCYIISEDERNDARIVTPRAEDGFGFDGVWADDFHHSVEVAVVDASRYKEDFIGEMHEVVQALNDGWIYQGQESRRSGEPRGTACRHIPPERFIFCISNHDQVGNRAFGERLNQLVPAPVYRAASALLLLSPYTPLLFQGQEWAPSSPFLYFTDHHDELGRAVEKGRREECRFEVFASGKGPIPSPQEAATFQQSKLKWEEATAGSHRETLELYRELLRIRRSHAAFRPTGRDSFRFVELPGGVLAMNAAGVERHWILLCDLRGGHSGTVAEVSSAQTGEGVRWVVELSTNERRFGGQESDTQFDPGTGAFHFVQPGVLLLRSQK